MPGRVPNSSRPQLKPQTGAALQLSDCTMRERGCHRREPRMCSKYKGGNPRRGVVPHCGDGLCLARAFCHGIHADVDDSSLERIDVEVLDPESTVFRGIRGVESVFGASKNRKTKNAQNRILDVRKFGQKVLKTTPRPSESDSP